MSEMVTRVEIAMKLAWKPGQTMDVLARAAIEAMLEAWISRTKRENAHDD